MQSTEVFNLSNDTLDNKTDTMVASFIKSVNNKNTLGNETISVSGIGNTLIDSFALSQTGATLLKQETNEIPLEVIVEDKDDNSQVSSKKGIPEEDRNKDFDHEEFRDDIDRYEEIDLRSVSMDSSGQETNKKRRQRGPLLSPEEIKSIKEEKKNEEIEDEIK